MSLLGEGALVIWHDIAPGCEGDYNEWHSKEHMLERVGVPVHEQPFPSFPAIDLGDAQGPLLVRQPADLAVLPLDYGQDGQVARCIGLYQLDLGISVPEIAGELRQPLGTAVEAPAGVAANFAEPGADRVAENMGGNRQGE